MKNGNKVISLLGIAKKAGKVVCGTEMTVESIRSGKKDSVKLIILSSDASKNTLKRIGNTSSYYEIPVITVPLTKSELAHTVGRVSETTVLGITDAGFCKAMLENAEQN